MVRACPRPNDEQPASDGDHTCVHIVKGTIPCRHCAQYDQMLPDMLHQTCHIMQQVKKRAAYRSDVQAHSERVKRLARYVRLAYEKGIAMDAMTKVGVLKAVTSPDELCAWLEMRDASEDELINGDVILRLVASDDPGTILKTLSLAIERKTQIFKRDEPLIKLFLRAARQNYSQRDYIAVVLKRLVFEETLTSHQAHVALRFALDPKINDDYESVLALLDDRHAFDRLLPLELYHATQRMLGMKLIDDETRHGIIRMLDVIM